MVRTIRLSGQRVVAGIAIGVCLLVVLLGAQSAAAITGIPDPAPEPGSFGLEATKTQDPPKTGASITTPANGASFSTSPITVNGICPRGLLVQVYDNGVMVGAVMCTSGSFSVQVSLFSGSNDLSAIVYDDLGQAGPTSNTVKVTYTSTQFSAFGQLITLTSSYGRRSAAAGTQLDWPLQLSGGSGPYAFSIDWGDGTAVDLKSQSSAGLVTISHIYKKAGIYQVGVKVTDVNGVSAFLQLVAVASGKVDTGGSTKSSATPTVQTKVVWIPAVIAVALLGPAFWLGRKSQLVSIRNTMLKERDEYQEK